MPLTKKDFEIANSTSQKNIFIRKKTNTGIHDFQKRAAAENRI
jgi:hypothetical protein